MTIADAPHKTVLKDTVQSTSRSVDLTVCAADGMVSPF